MDKYQIIIDMRAEDDEVTLYGLRSPTGWAFSRQVIANSVEWTHEAGRQRSQHEVTTWSAALKLLDQYPWQHWYPVEVHPEFRSIVLDAVVERFKSDVEKNPRRFADWTHKCVQPRNQTNSQLHVAQK